MNNARALLGILVVAACNGSEPKVTDPVDDVLAQACSAAAQCPGITATPAQIAACPAEIKASLGPTDLATLAAWAGYTSAEKTCVMTCVGGAICGRFGGSLSNISDSDVLEPFQTCSVSCGASALAASLVPVSLAGASCPRRLAHLYVLAHQGYARASDQ